MDYDQHDEVDHATMMFENKKGSCNTDVKKLLVLEICAYRCTHDAALPMPLLTIFFLRNSLACLAVARQDI